MSRLAKMSPTALRAFFSPDCDEQVIILVKLSGANISTPIRLADGFTKRLSETDDDVVYGVTSRGADHTFLPLEITLPGDADGEAPTAQLVIHNVTRELTPSMRGLDGPPDVDMSIILASSPDVLEVEFSGFKLSGFDYDAQTVSGALVVDSLAGEPFPQYSFTPNYFAGLF